MSRLFYCLVPYLLFAQVIATGQTPEKTAERNDLCPLAESLESFARHLTLQIDLYNMDFDDGSRHTPALKEQLEQACLSQLDMYESLVRTRSMGSLLGVDYRSGSGRAEMDSMMQILSALELLQRGRDPFAKTGLIKEDTSGRITLASEDIQSLIQTVRVWRQQFVTAKGHFSPKASSKVKEK